MIHKVSCWIFHKDILSTDCGSTRCLYIKHLFFLFFLIYFTISQAQDKGLIFGQVKDHENNPLERVNIRVQGEKTGISTGADGTYRLTAPAGITITIVYTFLGYREEQIEIRLVKDERREMNLRLVPISVNLPNVNIEEEKERDRSVMKVNPKLVNIVPVATSGIEALIKTFPGVSKSNELSSQYSVRGGNFDENLVYVNDVEIYRPFLIRSGQQEGLSFINSDMVSSVLFSAGGFEAKYGDKMSSVLDIRYKKPSGYGGSVTASLLGGSVHLEGSSDNHRFTHITGFRYKTTQYVLKSMDVKGDYKPNFFDLQTYLTYDASDVFEVSFLGNLAQNKYLFVPQTRTTKFGSVQNALMLTVYFDGREVDKFTTGMGAVTGTYHPNRKINLKGIVSVYKTHEKETFDIQGQYYLNEVNKQIGSEELGDSAINIGIGTYLDHARNYLESSIVNAEHKGTFYTEQNHFLMWGLKYQHEFIDDEIMEWQMLDSAGHSLPFPDTIGYTSDYVNIREYLYARNTIRSGRINGYIQDSYSFRKDSNEYTLTGGIRTGFWDFNNELIVSPRIIFSCKPNWERDFLFRIASGIYYQPPFYKEFRGIDGSINTGIKAQRSVHFVLGSDYNFSIWNRPFKFITEIYYKYLDRLIPYYVDNVRVRYYARNNAHGYAIGLDMKVNGEFVKGVESWASLSIMRTYEDIEDDFYFQDSLRIEPGYIPRPTDQLVNFGLFFQDYLPRSPSYKMQLSLLFGSALRFGPTNSERYQQVLRMPAYRRVDIGFSKVIKSENKELPPGNPLRHFKSLWAGIEVFNLLDINNTISYIWITDVMLNQYAVPNYLTSRRLNVKLIATF